MTTKSAPGRDEVSARNVWTPGQVADLLGVSPVTLRSWDARYGIGPTVRESGRQRRYSTADVAGLQRMQSLMSRGVRTREAAQLVLSGRDDPLVTGQAERTMQALHEAADGLRYATMAALLDDALAAGGVVTTWQEILVPLLLRLEESWTAGEPCFAAEWALAREISAALERYARPRSTALGGAPLLLACCPAERHTLPLEVLRGALAELNVAAMYLGPMVPPDTIVALTKHLSPAVVVLWSMAPGTADIGVLRRIRRAGGRPCLAGPGWNQFTGRRTPRVDDLPGALTRITEMIE
ncbi:MerR family transcriptional regulator [Amycolatopsis sp. 195334CR]|uniref:MerR family transcriptional regulator n=1 Tax=Amycolatopsis sp. 195334CR TaxID=2814588 RepID=UPI001A8CF1B1|nr:MerR family transcriptional regulator [Amycolatopsis sp. 195334CR]MBN6040323.1 MerR family transcriptional regulator [Amycolatopsis sp. 195334CR]